MTSTRVDKPGQSLIADLRAMAMTWSISLFLPLPILVATDPATSADVSCLYLGLASAWLAAEFHRACGVPRTLRAWHARTLAVAACVAMNVLVFVAFGRAAGVQTHFPFPLMAALSAFPAIGMIPWLLRRASHPYAAILYGGLLVLAAKLAGCVVARIVYGPDYIALGYVAADWRTAKLMISLLWSITTIASVLFLLADYIHCGRNELPTMKTSISFATPERVA